MAEHFDLTGDKTAAMQWLPFARKKLDQWKNLIGKGVLNQVMSIPNGQIRIKSDSGAGHDWIYINVDTGSFWWWRLFAENLPAGLTYTIKSADIPEGVSEPGLISGSVPTGYRSYPIYKQLGEVGTIAISKTGNLLRTAIHDFANKKMVIGSEIDNGLQQQPHVIFPLSFISSITGLPQNPVNLYAFLYQKEWGILYGGLAGGGGTDFRLAWGRYPTSDNPSNFNSDVTVNLTDAITVNTLPGPNGTAGVTRRTAFPTVWFGAFQGNNSRDPALPPPLPTAPLDRDFYTVSLIETNTVLDAGPPIKYQQAVIVRRRSITAPNTNIMSSSWYLTNHIQDAFDDKMLFSVYEYQGKLFLIFGRYVEDHPGTSNKDRNYFFDMYVIDKISGVLLDTQVNCGIRMWSETDQGLYGYAMPRVTFSYSGITRTAAHVLWALRKYEFGVDANALKLHIKLDSNNNPIQLLGAQTTYPSGGGSSPTGSYDQNNHIILQQH